jgi:FlaA1/EpsC-like NDP-sugar epimerase
MQETSKNDLETGLSELFGKAIALGGQRRFYVLVLLHLVMAGVANYSAFWLRFDGHIPPQYMELWKWGLPVLVAIRLVIFFPFRLYGGLWRYTSIHDLRRIVLAVGTGTVIFAFMEIFAGNTSYPRSIYLVDSLILIFLMGGARVGRKMLRDSRKPGKKSKTVLVYGAGDAGEMIVRDMKNNPFYDKEPLGFIDDDKTKLGVSIHGINVLGTRRDLPSILRLNNVSEILIAMPAAPTGAIRAIVSALEPFKIPIKTLPNLRDVLDGNVTVRQIRSLALEDLLPRAPVDLDPSPVHRLIAGRKVLVTGAGGSIGSELCRQIAGMKPDLLILLERHENSLYEIYTELSAQYPDVRGVIGDITDAGRVDEVLRSYKPSLIFHAAAHKHVPIMEENPCEAVKNNVYGSRVLIESAERHGVQKFVFISTDKAVNPSSVMGATKRVTELMIQSRRKSETEFMAVRFGNVMGSNGSVIPLFLRQIEKGGPVTVTHPDIKRYFMLIPEAVQLVLQAAAIGGPGHIYVLDMGNEFKVLDLARNLIRISGYIPDKEIPITFVGLRPGEKLSEELAGVDEVVSTSQVSRISRIISRRVTEAKTLYPNITSLESYALKGDTNSLMECLSDVVPSLKSLSHQLALTQSARVG